MLYQLVRTAGGIPGPLAVLFDRTPVEVAEEVAEEKVPTLRVAPTRAARAREPSMVAERYRRFMTGSREGVGFLITEGGWEEVAGRLRFFGEANQGRKDTLDFVKSLLILISLLQFGVRSCSVVSAKPSTEKRLQLLGHDNDTRSSKVLGCTVDSIIGIDGIVASPVHLKEEVKA